MKLKLQPHGTKGKLIVFEGTDGSGKSSLLEKTASFLNEKIGNDQLLIVKQPTELSRKTRLFQKMMYSPNHTDIDYRAVQLLTLSDRLQHQHEVIVPALNAGKTILADRYIFTSVANMECRGYCNEDWFYIAARHIIRPDLCILASVSPALAISRIRQRPDEQNRYFDEDLLARVAMSFKKHVNDWHMLSIDTSKTINKVFEGLCPVIKKLYGV